jgi:hypothetical protein
LIEKSNLLEQCASIEARRVYKSCDLSGSLFMQADAQAISFLLAESHHLWGERGKYFLVISQTEPKPGISLIDRIADIEAGISEGVLVIAYNDGGLIAVAGVRETLLSSQPTAEWWYPT